MWTFISVVFLTAIPVIVLWESDHQIIASAIGCYGLLYAISFLFKEREEENLWRQIIDLFGGLMMFVTLGIFIQDYFDDSPTPSSPIQQDKNYFYNYECTGSDCEGHKEGFNDAKANNIQYASDCRGESQSYIEGCEAWVKNSPDPVWDTKE